MLPSCVSKLRNTQGLSVCVPSHVLCLFPLGQKTLKDFVLQDKELYRTVPSSCLPDKGTLRGSVSFLCLQGPGTLKELIVCVPSLVLFFKHWGTLSVFLFLSDRRTLWGTECMFLCVSGSFKDREHSRNECVFLSCLVTWRTGNTQELRNWMCVPSVSGVPCVSRLGTLLVSGHVPRKHLLA